MKRILSTLILSLVLTSCGETDLPRLEEGTFKAELGNETLCVDILPKGKCRVYFYGFDPSDGEYTYSGSLVSIKGAASRPDPTATPGTITERWRYICVFTGNAGDITDERNFNYFVDVEMPLHEKETKYLHFQKP